MKQVAIAPIEVKTEHPEQNFSWISNQSVQKLLDVIANILASEYISVAKENPELFKEIASPPPRRGSQ